MFFNNESDCTLWSKYNFILILTFGIIIGSAAVNFIKLPASTELAKRNYTAQEADVILRYVDHVLLHGTYVNFNPEVD